MKRFLFSFNRGEAIVLLVSIGSIVAVLFANVDRSIEAVLLGILTSASATTILITFERYSRGQGLEKYYHKFEGQYVRVEIGQDNTPFERMGKMKRENEGLIAHFKYLGDHRFEAEMLFWINEKVKAYFEFDPVTKLQAAGSYKYYEVGPGSTHRDHFGSMRLFIFNDQLDTIYILYQHIYPRLREVQDPDNNRGWQVFKRAPIPDETRSK